MRSKLLAIALAAAVIVVAVVVVVLVVRDPDPKASATDGATDEPSAASTDPGHSPDDGHDHIDDIDPDIDPDDYQEFCSAFLVLADAYSQRTADRTPETIAATEAAADELLAVGEETDMTDEVRAGFEGFVADVLEKPNEATVDEQGAFSTFLNSSCPA